MSGVGISDYGSYFRNYRIPDIRDVRTEQIDKQEQMLNQVSGQPDKTVITEQENDENKAGKHADLENISLKFNIGDDYSYIGSDSDIESLDMRKAISDMKKDSVLQQYQYFVGTAHNLMSNGMIEDGMVVPKFDIV